MGCTVAHISRLQSVEFKAFIDDKHTFRDITIMAEEAKQRGEIAKSVYQFFILDTIDV